jgi:hypothetical protein
MSSQNYGIGKFFLPWKDNFYQLISLWEIMETLQSYARHIANFLLLLYTYEQKFGLLGDNPVPENERELMNDLFISVSPMINDLCLGRAVNKFFQGAARTLQNGSGSEINIAFEKLRETMSYQLNDVMFLHILPENIKYYDERQLFKSEPFKPYVKDKFPITIRDIEEAGKCFALGRYTGCVFHLMRVAEIGLRALARDRRIKFDKKSPIELKQWKEIFDKLENEEGRIKNLPTNTAREAQFAFYHGAMMDLRAFQHLYRDRTMHAREFYDREQANKAMSRVASFMNTLAEKISETKRTPLNWKKP